MSRLNKELGLLQGIALSTAALALPAWARAATAAATDAPILRAIPSSGERIPVVGLGTNAYGVQTAEEQLRDGHVPREQVIGRNAATGARHGKFPR